MAKFAGLIGFSITEEVEPGIYEPTITPKKYYGDVLRNTRKWASSGAINDDLDVSVQISIVADKFAYDHFESMRWVEYVGVKWKITNVDIQYPRLIIDVGGVYND